MPDESIGCWATTTTWLTKVISPHNIVVYHSIDHSTRNEDALAAGFGGDADDVVSRSIASDWDVDLAVGADCAAAALDEIPGRIDEHFQ